MRAFTLKKRQNRNFFVEKKKIKNRVKSLESMPKTANKKCGIKKNNKRQKVAFQRRARINNAQNGKVK